MNELEQKLDRIISLRSMAAIFGYLNLKQSDMIKEQEKTTKEIEQDNKNFFLKVFRRPLYKTRMNNMYNTLSRINTIVSLLEANPNKGQDFTLNQVIDENVAKISKHIPEEKVLSIRRLANSRFDNVMSVDHIRIRINPDQLYIKDLPAKENIQEEQTTPIKNQTAKINDKEMNM